MCGRDSFGNRGRKAGYTSVLQVCANVSLVPHRGTRGGIGQSIDAAYGVITMTETQHSIKMRSRGARVGVRAVICGTPTYYILLTAELHILHITVRFWALICQSKKKAKAL